MPDAVRNLYLYFPKPQLSLQARILGLKTTGVRKIEMAKAVANAMEPTALQDLLADHIYARIGTIRWFTVPQPEHGTLSVREVENRLTKVCGANPFAEDLKPQLTESPQVVSVKVYSPSKIIVQFAHEELRTRIIRYEMREEPETLFSCLVIRLGSVFFECRADKDKSYAIADNMCQILGFDKPVPAILDDQRISALIDALNGTLVSAKHKHRSGELDTTEVVVSPELGDLRRCGEYMSGLDVEPSRRKRLSFDFPPGSGQRISMEVYTPPCIFRFRSYTNEQVIDYVFSKVREVAGL